MIGEQVGNYRVVERIGAGGMGNVYLAEHPVMGRRVALKILRPEWSTDPEAVERFFTEARSVNAIRHPHIVEIYDLGKTPAGSYYLSMELLEGETLSQRIKASGAMPPVQAVQIATQVAVALGAAHARGIVHRDVKPQNIYLVRKDDEADYVKLVDFGLVKLVGDGSEEFTRAGRLLGTPQYMSPEQCEGNRDIDHRSDIYSLGVVLFGMLTGRLPFEGSDWELIGQHIDTPAPRVRDLKPDTPEALDYAVARALAKSPDFRYQSMDDFRRAIGGEAISVTGPLPKTRPRQPSGEATIALPTPAHASGSRSRSGTARREDPARPRWLALAAVGGLGAVIVTVAIVVAASSGRARGRDEAARETSPPEAQAPVGGSSSAATSGAVATPTQPPAAVAAPRSVRIFVSSSPEGAEVFSDDLGSALGTTPFDVALPASGLPERLVFRRPGHIERWEPVERPPEGRSETRVHAILEPEKQDASGSRAGARKKQKRLFDDL